MRNVFRLQKMIRSLFILTALLLCQIPSSKAQLTTPIPTDDGPYFESEFVRPQILEAYYSMFSKLPPNKDFAALFPPKPDILSAETRKSLRLIWSGSESSYAAELTATLFLTPADANSQNSAFSLDLIFEPSTEERQGTLLVKASESFKKGMKRGVVVKFPAEGRQDFFIDGTNNTDLIVSVLPETSTSPGAVGICPVELKGKVTASRGGNLVPVNYQLDDVEYHAA
ncbi:MAG: hypothetical protein KDD53_05935, partial [Bdellovibrionales bacterium]|nr:hypothetical protein [Bdellovibrionales bacterium]